MSKKELYSKIEGMIDDIREVVKEYLVNNNITDYDEMLSVSIDLKSKYNSCFLLYSDETIKEIKDRNNGVYAGADIHILDYYRPDFNEEEEE